jgi:hypothetical protein
MICEDGPKADKIETLFGISRDNKKKYFGTKEFKQKEKETTDSMRDKKDTDDMLGSFINFDVTDDKDTDLSDKDLSQDYFMLNKAQSQMDVTVTTTLKDDKKVKNHIVV